MITPTSVEPYMLHGVTPMVFSIHSHVRESIGSPVNEMRSRASRRPSASPEARSMRKTVGAAARLRSEEHTSELQSRLHLVCRLLLEKKKNTICPPLADAAVGDHSGRAVSIT